MPAAGASLWERFWAFAFYQHALLAGVMVALACAVLSVFVVHRRMAFIGEGISHAAFGGISIALLLELVFPSLRHPLLRQGIVAVFCVGTAILMGRIGRQRRVGTDSAIGIALTRITPSSRIATTIMTPSATSRPLRSHATGSPKVTAASSSAV